MPASELYRVCRCESYKYVCFSLASHPLRPWMAWGTKGPPGLSRLPMPGHVVGHPQDQRAHRGGHHGHLQKGAAGECPGSHLLGVRVYVGGCFLLSLPHLHLLGLWAGRGWCRRCRDGGPSLLRQTYSTRRLYRDVPAGGSRTPPERPPLSLA